MHLGTLPPPPTLIINTYLEKILRIGYGASEVAEQVKACWPDPRTLCEGGREGTLKFSYDHHKCAVACASSIINTLVKFFKNNYFTLHVSF